MGNGRKINDPAFAEEVYRQRDAGASLMQITRNLQCRYPQYTEHQLWERVRACFRHSEYRAKHKVYGVFSDIHAPFDNKEYLPFLLETFKKFGVTDYVCLGDLVDFHILSKYTPEPCAMGAYRELDKALDTVARYTEAFPKCHLTFGNHDVRPEKLAASVGIGARLLKSFADLLELPPTWKVADEFVLNGVLYKHGINCLGKNGAINAAIQERMSTVIGHSHSYGGVQYIANNTNSIFGMNVGCGIDVEAYAFAYGRHDKVRPTLGCGIVFSDEYAIYVPMRSK